MKQSTEPLSDIYTYAISMTYTCVPAWEPRASGPEFWSRVYCPDNFWICYCQQCVDCRPINLSSQDGSCLLVEAITSDLLTCWQLSANVCYLVISSMHCPFRISRGANCMLISRWVLVNTMTNEKILPCVNLISFENFEHYRVVWVFYFNV